LIFGGEGTGDPESVQHSAFSPNKNKEGFLVARERGGLMPAALLGMTKRGGTARRPGLQGPLSDHP
jgi:hypothetical protein